MVNTPATLSTKSRQPLIMDEDERKSRCHRSVIESAMGSKELFSQQWKGFDGPAIQISTIYGSTSGRFSVARMIARVFPDHMSFVKDVIAEEIAPASDFPSGPYHADKLKYLTAEMVE